MATHRILCSSILLLLALSMLCSSVSSATISSTKPICSEEVIKTLEPDEEEYETILEPADFEKTGRVSIADKCKNLPENPEMSGKFEGDIAGFEDKDLKKYIRNSNQLARNAINSKWRLWPKGVIPYTISSRYGRISRQVLADAMQEYSDKTCIEFVPRNTERDYIHIMPDDGCYSLVGRVGGKQIVSLDAGCIQFGTVVHELMHSVGFFHEQSRNDRDEWIRIIESNVMNGAMDQFEKYSLRTISHLDTEYDYNSIMHYGPYAFSRNGLRTIKPRKSGGSKMGQRDGFSATDKIKINKLYKCADVTDKNNNNNNNNNKKVVTIDSEEEVETGTGVSECVDRSWRCIFWSMAIFDYCEKYESMRTSVCPKSCGACGEGNNNPEASCKDNNSNCKKWGDQGYCNRRSYSDFMKEKCPKTCNMC